MIAGRPPFDGVNALDVISEILQKEPPRLDQQAAHVPAELQRIVSKTLRKDRHERYQTARDLLNDLKDLKITSTGFFRGRRCGFEGGFIPFVKIKAERLASGDPRLSLEEGYGDHAGYVAIVKTAVDGLLRQHFLLPEDAVRLIRQAETSNVLENGRPLFLRTWDD